MSKYSQRGDYHFQEYKAGKSPYFKHVQDAMLVLERWLEPDHSILDVGCGEGLFVFLLSAKGWLTTGIEIDSHAVQLAAKRNLRVIEMPFERVDDSSHYDAILFMDSLEHVDDYESVLATAGSMTDKLFIAIPDRDDPHATKMITPDDVIAALPGFEIQHLEQRHARHFMVFTKLPKVVFKEPRELRDDWPTDAEPVSFDEIEEESKDVFPNPEVDEQY